MYVSDIDSIKFNVKNGTKINFDIVVSKDTFSQQILGIPYIPKANYSNKFQSQKKGHIDFSIPELYELVNVVVALTNKGIEDKERVNKNTEYYKSVLGNFSSYRNHDIVEKFNKFISQTVQPAVELVAKELQENSIKVEILNENGLSLIVDHGEEQAFVYRVISGK